jgi:hypothetical protein
MEWVVYHIMYGYVAWVSDCRGSVCCASQLKLDPAHRPRNHTLYDIPPIRFVFQVQWNLGSRTPLITNKSVHGQVF